MDRIVAGMLFGALPDCPEKCSEGHLYYDKVSGKYKCSGNASEWAKCMFESDEVSCSTLFPLQLPLFFLFCISSCSSSSARTLLPPSSPLFPPYLPSPG